MYSWHTDKNEIKTKTVNAIMGELEYLLEPPNDTVHYWLRDMVANYWIDDRHNVFAFINDNGDDDRWIEIHYELHDCNEDMIGDLLAVDTDDVDREELLKAVKEIVDAYYGD